MERWRVRERTFKRLSFASTILGVLVMAVALQQALLVGRAALGVALFVAGALVALASVFLEPEPEAGFTVTLYTRQDCSLCDAARAFLVGKKREYDFDVWEIDVDHDAAAGARYSDWVPVAIVTHVTRGRGRGHGRIVRDEELFRLAPDYPRLEARLRELADARLRR